MKSIANIITSLRIPIAVGILFTRVWSPVFWCLYGVGGLSDIMDGEIARRSHTESRTGAMLDSIADICFIAACMVVMLPALDIPLWVWIWAACIAFIKLVNLVSGLVCHHKLMLLHTRANKLTGLLLFLLPVAAAFIPIAIPAVIVCLVATFAAVQEGHFIRAHLLLPFLFLPMASCGQETDSARVCAFVVNDTESKGVNEDTICPLFSVVKYPQAIYVAHCLSAEGISLQDSVLVEKRNMMSDTWSPMLDLFEQSRYFSYAELLRLSLQESDNNACDILFDAFGGTAETEKYISTLGFSGIKIGATERQMMNNPDTAFLNAASPKEMARLLEWFFLHHEDNPDLSYVWNLMADCHTGKGRIAGVLSEKDTLFDKTGTGFTTEGNHAVVNDAGIVFHPDGSHTVVVLFVDHPKGVEEAEEVLRDTARRLFAQ